MRFGRVGWSLTAALLGASACVPATRVPAKIEPAHDVAARVVVLDDFAPTWLPWASQPDQPEKDEWAKNAVANVAGLPAEVRRALSQAGYTVVTLGEPHDVEVRLSATTQWAVPGNPQCYRTTGSVAALVRRGSQPIENIALSLEQDPPCDGNFAQIAAAEIVNRFSASPKVARAMKASAVAAASPAPVAPATPAPAPAAAPTSPEPAKPQTATAFVAGAPQPTAYALIVGIEKYRDAPAASGAELDAQRFVELAKKTLGIREENIRTALNDRATKVDIQKQVDWLRANVPAGGRVYFFYSGHGAPDASAGTSYLFPYDGDASALDRTALPLADMLSDLGKSKAREVVAVVDSCFSGAGGRSVLPKGARPLVRVKETTVLTHISLFSAASGAEISGPASEGAGGLFSKYVSEGLGGGKADIDGDGQITMKELSEWVRPRVAREAKRDNREQNPSLTAGAGASDVVVASGIR